MNSLAKTKELNISPIYSEYITKNLFNNLSETYFLNNVFSYGLANLIRKKNINILFKLSKIRKGLIIADFMSGSGENNTFLDLENNSVVNIDFSSKMMSHTKSNKNITFLNENVLNCSLKKSSVDAVISSFGLKTLSRQATKKLAKKTNYVLKSNGSFSYCEFNFKGFSKFLILSIISFLITLSIIFLPKKKTASHYKFLTYTNLFKGEKVYRIFKKELPNTKKVNILGIVIFIYGKKL